MLSHSEYDKDFYSWLMKNAQLLREHKVSDIDSEHIAEELESMGKSEKRQLINRLSISIFHMLLSYEILILLWGIFSQSAQEFVISPL